MSSDANYLNHLRTVQARGFYANFTLTIVAVGIHLFMALYGLSVFLETPGPQRKGRKRYIIASFLITVLSALSASLDMANYFQVLFAATSPTHWRKLMVISFMEGWKRLVGNTAFAFVIMIGDALLVYRCYIVCVEYWWVTILPMLTSLSALVLFLKPLYQSTTDTATHEASASTFLTVSTNILVTGFITFRLLLARQRVAKLLPTSDARLYIGVIAILIESAAPVTVFGIIVAILQEIVGPRGNHTPGFYVAVYLFQALFYSFCALSPHMIIFRVTTGRSFTKFPSPSQGADGGLSNPIQFARQTAESSFLQSTLNREFGRDRQVGVDTERGMNESVDYSTRTQTSIMDAEQEKKNEGSIDSEGMKKAQ